MLLLLLLLSFRYIFNVSLVVYALHSYFENSWKVSINIACTLHVIRKKAKKSWHTFPNTFSMLFEKRIWFWTLQVSVHIIYICISVAAYPELPVVLWIHIVRYAVTAMQMFHLLRKTLRGSHHQSSNAFFSPVVRASASYKLTYKYVNFFLINICVYFTPTPVSLYFW